MTITIAKARSLCTKPELDLVTASSRKNLPTHSAARLKQKVARARKLRDKWLDQAHQQRRAKQAAEQARGTSAAARSEQKAELFAEVLDRFEKQLEKVEKAGATGGVPKRRTPPRRARAVEHREARAATREAMQTEQEAITTERGAGPEAPETPAAEPCPRRKCAGKKAAKKAVKKSAKKARKAVRARKKKAAAMGAATEAAAPKPAAVKKKTLRAATAAKQTRVTQSGSVRVQKHVSARGRRNQARRDSRR